MNGRGYAMESVRKIVIRATIKVVCLVLVVTGITAILYPLFGTKKECQIPIRNDWTVQINSQTYDTKYLSSLTFPLTEKGDRITLTTILPKTDFKQVSLRFHAKHSTVHVYMDGEEIYAYGEEYAQKNQMVGSGDIWIELPYQYEGKQLQIVQNVQENGAFSRLSEVYLQETGSIYSDMISGNLLTGLVSGFLLCFGWVTLIITACMHGRGRRLHVLFWIAGFAILVAQWLVCYSQLIELMTTDFHLICNIEYISLYLAPICMLFFLYDMLVGARYRKTIRWLGIAFAGCDAVLLFLNFTNIAHFSRTLILYHIMALVCGISIVVISLKWANQTKKTAVRIFAAGILVFICFVAADILRYTIDQYGWTKLDLSVTLMQVGLLAFVIAMILSFVFMLMERVAENMERKTLIQMAYTDALTNIKNRASCEEVFRQYDQTATPLTIINMDLNCFKEINDIYGHAVGDELLMRFASILENTFAERGFVGRMGGDEFIVILDYCPRDVVEEYMSEMGACVESANASGNRPYSISVSYGYADNYEKPHMSAWKVYEQADHHMYDYKRHYKEKGGV